MTRAVPSGTALVILALIYVEYRMWNEDYGSLFFARGLIISVMFEEMKKAYDEEYAPYPAVDYL